MGDYYNWHQDSGNNQYYKPIKIEQSAEGSLDNNDEFLINSVKINCEIIILLGNCNIELFYLSKANPISYFGFSY